MKKAVYLINLIAILILGCQSRTVGPDGCKQFGVADGDSICVRHVFDPDSLQLDSIVRNSSTNTLIVFSAYGIQDKLFYQDPELINDDITAELQKYQLAILHVDDDTNNSYAATFENRKFKLDRMLYYAIVNSKFEVVKTMEFTRDQNEIKEFLSE